MGAVDLLVLRVFRQATHQQPRSFGRHDRVAAPLDHELGNLDRRSLAKRPAPQFVKLRERFDGDGQLPKPLLDFCIIQIDFAERSVKRAPDFGSGKIGPLEGLKVSDDQSQGGPKDVEPPISKAPVRG